MANTYINKVIVNGQVKIDLSGDTITAADVINGKTFHDRTGAPVTGTCTYDADTSDATISADEILAGEIGYGAGSKIVGTMPNIGAQNGSITTKAQRVTISRGYHDGSGGVAIDATEQAKIVPANIRSGVVILGVTGTMTGTEDINLQAKSVTPTFSSQTVTPDSDYNGLSQVTVSAIPVTEVDNAQGGVTVTVG